MKIAQLAKAGDVGVETVRYYQRIGLLAKPARSAGFREYGAYDIQRLRFIRRAHFLGFTLEEVSNLLALSVSDCENVERIARERLTAILERIADLHRVEAVLTDVIHRCSAREPYQGCPIIETLARD
jgi:MerR family mercuric resistance operon transcriptional regulator